MMPSGGGAPERSLVGMARLSCVPCRKRKSKCDRAEPCSSCVLRNTERFCYTSEMEEESTNKGSSPIKRPEKKTSGSSHSESPNSSSTKGQTGRKPNKKFKLDSGDTLPTTTRRASGSGEALMSYGNSSLDAQAILKTIESMKATIRTLQQTIGVREDETEKAGAVSLPDMVGWRDVSHLLPSKEECVMIIDCFFSDASWQTSVVNQNIFRRDWRKLQAGIKVRRTFIAMVCGILAHALLLTPGYNPTSRLSIQSESRSYCELAHRLIQPLFLNIFETVTPRIEELQVSCLIFGYMSYGGWSDPAWAEVGRGIRACKVLQLYDESKWSLRELSDWDVEIRRRVAWDFASTDWWLSLHYLRISDIPPTINTLRPNYYSDDCYSETGRMIATKPTFIQQHSFLIAKEALSCGSLKVNQFLTNFPNLTPLERYKQARDLDAYLHDAQENKISAEIQYESACDVNKLTNPDSSRSACQSLICFTSVQRLRCTVMRQFLLDRDAPMDLRMAALEYARRIIETTPTLVTLSSSPWVSFSSAWCSGHLFCAASTFAIVYLGETDQDSQDLNWFATKIFEVIEALSYLGAKDRVAKRCEELLTALCTGKDWLRERFLASRSCKLASYLSAKDSEGKTITNKGSAPQARRSQVEGFEYLQTPDKSSLATYPPANSTSPTEGSSGNNTVDQNGFSTLTTSPASYTALNINTSTTDTPAYTNSAQNGQSTNPIESSSSLAEPWGNWPLLNDQQWSSLLSSLEQDMDALPSTSAPVGTSS